MKSPLLVEETVSDKVENNLVSQSCPGEAGDKENAEFPGFDHFKDNVTEKRGQKRKSAEAPFNGRSTVKLVYQVEIH